MDGGKFEREREPTQQGRLLLHAQECCIDFDPKQTSVAIGHDNKALESIPESSILGLGCGAPLNFADMKQDEL